MDGWHVIEASQQPRSLQIGKALEQHYQSSRCSSHTPMPAWLAPFPLTPCRTLCLDHPANGNTFCSHTVTSTISSNTRHKLRPRHEQITTGENNSSVYYLHLLPTGSHRFDKIAREGLERTSTCRSCQCQYHLMWQKRVPRTSSLEVLVHFNSPTFFLGFLHFSSQRRRRRRRRPLLHSVLSHHFASFAVSRSISRVPHPTDATHYIMLVVVF